MEKKTSLNRRGAREGVLKTLYAAEVGEQKDIKVIYYDIAQSAGLDPDMTVYGMELAQKTFDTVEEIDRVLQKHTANWELKRLSAIDRNILRMAVAELWFFEDIVPFKVVIDEAVELAKEYGTDDSGKFVNGVIDSIRKSEDGKIDT